MGSIILKSRQFIPVLFCLFFLASCGDDELSTEDYIGNYIVSEICDGDTYNYSLVVSNGQNGDKSLSITNLWDWEEVMTATINDSNLTLPNQELDGVIFEGSGTLSGNILTITYTATDQTEMETCVATCTKS